MTDTMTGAVSSPTEAAAGPHAPRGPQRTHTWLVAVGVGLLVTLLRWWVSRERTVFSMQWDEAANLAIARSLGGQNWSTRDLTFSPGLGTLLAPIHWVTDDPTTTYQASLALTAVFAGVAAALLVLLLARVTAAPLPWVAVAALTVALIPGTFLQTMWVTPESLVAAVVVGTMLALVRLVESPTLKRGLVAAVMPGVGMASHARLGPLLVSVAAVLVALMVLRRLSPSRGVPLLTVSLIVTLAAQRYSDWVVDTVWLDGDESSRVDDLLTKLAQPVEVGLSAMGMVWYQLVTTAGVVVVGAWAIWAALRRRFPGASIGLLPVGGLVVLVVAVPSMALGAVWIATHGLPGHMVYGRYWDPLLGPVVALGVLVLAVGSRPALVRVAALTLTSLAGFGGVFAALRQDDIDAAWEARGGLGPTRRTLSLVAYLGDGNAIDILRITGVALGLSAVLLTASAVRLWASRVGSVALVIVLVVIVGTANHHVWRVLDIDTFNRLASASVVTDATAVGLAPGQVVGLQWDTPGVGRKAAMNRWLVYQFYLPDNPVVVLGDRKLPQEADPRYVFASPQDPRFGGSGYQLVWSHPDEPFALWSRTGP